MRDRADQRSAAVLELNGKDQRDLSLEERKARLADLLTPGAGRLE